MTIEEINNFLPQFTSASIVGDILFITKWLMIREHKLIHNIDSDNCVVCSHCGAIYDTSKLDNMISPCCNKEITASDFVRLEEYLINY